MLLIPLLILVGCGKDKKDETTISTSEPEGMVIEETVKKRSDVINNILVGNSKISFNNVDYDVMSEGEFKQSELWGTFKKDEKSNTYLQIDAFSNEESIYGDLEGFELKDVDWSEAEPVQYLGMMEEALQYSKDGNTLMYKARSGDIIFSVTLFGEKKLTEEEVLELKALAKGIKIEYVGDQIGTSEG